MNELPLIEYLKYLSWILNLCARYKLHKMDDLPSSLFGKMPTVFIKRHYVRFFFTSLHHLSENEANVSHKFAVIFFLLPLCYRSRPSTKYVPFPYFLVIRQGETLSNYF